MRSLLLPLVLLAALAGTVALALGGCGSSSSSETRADRTLRLYVSVPVGMILRRSGSSCRRRA
jgi:hypothetical protein